MQRKIVIWAVALVLAAAASAADKEEVSPDKFVFSYKPGEAGYVTELMFLDRMDEAPPHMAEALLKLGTDADGKSGTDYYYYLMGLLGRGRLDDADKLSGETEAEHPDAPLVREGRLAVLTALGRQKEAYDETGWFFDLYNNKLYGKEDADPVALACVAAAIFRENPDSDKRAFRILETVVGKTKPEFHLAAYWLADIAIQRYHWEYAQKVLDDLLKQSPFNTYARLKRAELYIEQGRYDDAQADVDYVIKLAPTMAEAYALKAEILYAEEDMQAAWEAVKKALSANPLSIRALALKAAVEVEKGEDYSAGEKAAEKYGPRRAEFYHSMARTLARRRRFEQAVDLARKSVAADKTYWQGYYEAGVNLLRLGEEQKAYEVLKRSFALNPFNIWAFNMLQMLDRRFKPGEMKDIEGKKFVVRVPQAESKIYGDMIDGLYKGLIPEYEAKYKTTVRGPDETGGRLLVEVLMDHNDFSVRSVGLPNLDALGVCFGRIVTMPSPRDLKARLGEVNWRIVLRHETSHAFTLQLSDFRIPRWLTEGIAMHDEGLPGYQWDTMLAYAYHNNENVSLAGLNKFFGRPEGRRDVELAYSISYLAVGWIYREWGASAPYRLALAYKKYGISAHSEAVHEALNMDLGNFDSRLRAELKRYVEENVPLLPPVSEKALEEATKALQLHPTDQSALTTLIRGLMASGQVREGDELLKRALSLYSHDPVLIAIKAQRLLDGGKNEEAWTAIEPTVKDVAGARFWNTFLAGIASAGMGEDERAVELLTAAEKKCPHYIDANNPGKLSLRVLLAKSLQKLKRNKEAIAYLDKELEFSTSSLAAAKMLDEVAKLEGDNEKRLVALDRMVDVDPFNSETRLTRCEVLMALEKAEEAFSEARAASVLEEESTKPLEDMVKAAVSMGDKIGLEAAKEALEASRKLAAADPKNAVLARYAKELAALKEKADGK